MSDKGASIADAAMDSGAWGNFYRQKRASSGGNANGSHRSLSRLAEQEEPGASATAFRSNGGDRGGSRRGSFTTPKSPSHGAGSRLR